MENIPSSKLKQVAKEASELVNEINAVVDWSEKFLKEDIQKTTTGRLKKARREVKRIQSALSQNPSAALYGESQVGKSYLIKNLLSEEGKKFTITDSSTETDWNFLEEINPKGEGTEATSVVTRFSTKVDIPDKRFPVKIQLLSPKDLVLLLCDSYFSDVEEHVALPNDSKIEKHLDELEQLFADSSNHQTALSEDDIYDIRDYLEQHFRNATTDLINSNYWDVVSANIHRVEYSEWYRVFEIIWGENKHVNTVFNRFMQQLKQLNFAPVAYAEFKAVLRDYGTILHVARLREINGEPLFEDVSKEKFIQNVDVIIPGDQGMVRQVVNKSLLCALSAELVFKVEPSLEKFKPFLRHSDLLDFPGARSRLKNQESKLNETHIGDMVLRGKVSYIFNKYSSQYLISSLFFCNKNQKIEVKYIPKLLNTWIETYIGQTPEKRQEFLTDATLPPLFVIYTFFNADLEFNPINDREDTLAEKWTKRFNTIFENEIVTNNFDWHKNWTVAQPFFQNNYMLRDFHYSNAIFGGFRDNGMEEKFPIPVKSIDNYMDEMKDSFINHEFVRKHFAQPEATWDAAATANQDGSKLIIKNLAKVSNNYARTQKFIRELNRISKYVRSEISRHHHSDEADKRIQKAAAQAGAIHVNMDIVFGLDPNAFSRFIKTFTIKESVVYNFFKDMLTKLELIEITNINHYILIRNSNPDLSINASFEDNLKVLMKTYNLQSQKDAETHFAEQGISLTELFYGSANKLKNNSLALAEALRDLWFETYLSQERFASIIDLGFSPSALEDLFDNIKVAFEKQNLVKIIAQNLREYVDRFDKIDVAEEMIADISAGIINKFVTSMGWHFYSRQEILGIKATNLANDLGLNVEMEGRPDYTENEDLAALFDRLHEYNELISQVKLNHEVVKNFPNVWNISRWRDLMKISFIANCDIPTYDMMANNALGELIDRLEKYSFQLN